MRYIQCQGGIWRVTEANYKILCDDIRNNKDVDLDNYGRMVVSNLVDLEDLQHNIGAQPSDAELAQYGDYGSVMQARLGNACDEE
jgi:hypothetical protein